MVSLLRYTELGSTGLCVSILCFGTLPLGPAHYNLSLNDGRELLKAAYDMGVNFFDTAELYGTYPYLRQVAALPGTVISSRSYAVTASDMKKSLDLARRQLDRDCIDIFGLHEQESSLTLKGHREALDYLCRAREKGIIRAVSVSTHRVGCVLSASLMPEIDVIFAILNVEGIGIPDGSRADMENALIQATRNGKGVYLMKVLGGGHLYRDAYRALTYARDFPGKHSVCVGIKDTDELQFAARVLCGEDVPESCRVVQGGARKVIVEDWCEGCGRCVQVCGFSAMEIRDGTARVDREKCMLCGYCARVCPHFCIKVL